MDPRPALAFLSLPALVAQAPVQTPVDPGALSKQANEAYQKKEWKEAARLYRLLASVGFDRTNTRYNAACCLALDGKSAEAFQELGLVLDAGFADPVLMEGDEDLKSLKSEAAWGPLVARAKANEAKLHDPERARIVTSDIPLFWRAYDLAAKEATREGKVRVFETEYYAKGSVGLQDFRASKIGSAEALVKALEKAPAFYAAVRPRTLMMASQEAGIRAVFRRLKAIYPDAVFRDMYFLVGRMNSAGTVSGAGQLIGTEMFGKDPSVPMGELSIRLKQVLMPVSDVPAVMAHELIHSQQRFEIKSLLANAIQEGSADFIGELIKGNMGSFNAFLHQYGRAHERELWETFKKDMHGKDASHWIANGADATAEKPADLGYFVGYRITEAYYRRAKDKGQALKDILTLKDADRFLQESGYEEDLMGPAKP